MVNGTLLLNREYSLERHLHKIVMIAVLFLVWSAITLISLAPLFGDHYSASQFIEAIYYTKEGRTTHLWFLNAMVYLYLMSPLIKTLYDKHEKRYTAYLWVLVFICTFGIVLFNNLVNSFGYLSNNAAWQVKHIDLFLWINPFSSQFSYVLVYFIAGGWIANNIKTIKASNTIWILLLLGSWLFLFLFGLIKTIIHGELYDTTWNGYNTVMTLLMSMSVFVLCSRIHLPHTKLKKAITTISTNSLGIYFIHIPVGFWLAGYYEKFAISNYLLVDICYALFLVVVSLIISMILKKIPVLERLVKI